MWECGNVGTVPSGLAFLEGEKTIASCAATGYEDRRKFAGFVPKPHDILILKKTQILSKFHPELCFITFFNHDTHLGYELFSRSGSVSRPVVGRNRGSGSHQLAADIL